MGPAAAMLIAQAASMGMGAIQSSINDRRQQRIQGEMYGQNYEWMRKHTDYQAETDFEMWQRTGPVGMVKELQKAGLNPGLMYGMGGAAGQTTGHGAVQPQQPDAPKGGGELIAMAGMGMQIPLQAAQVKLLDAQAENVKADTAKKTGVDTEKTAMETEKLFQEWQNLKQTHNLQELEATMKNIENFEKQTSQGNRLRYIQYQTETALHNLKLVQNENQISDATIQDQIKTIKQEAIYSVLKNTFTKAQTDKTKSDTIVNDAQMRKWSLELMQGWDAMEQKNRDLLLKSIEQMGGSKEAVGQSIDKILGIIF